MVKSVKFGFVSVQIANVQNEPLHLLDWFIIGIGSDIMDLFTPHFEYELDVMLILYAVMLIIGMAIFVILIFIDMFIETFKERICNGYYRICRRNDKKDS